MHLGENTCALSMASTHHGQKNSNETERFVYKEDESSIGSDDLVMPISWPKKDAIRVTEPYNF